MTRWYLYLCVHTYASRGYTCIYIKGAHLFRTFYLQQWQCVIYICVYIHMHQGGIHAYISRRRIYSAPCIYNNDNVLYILVYTYICITGVYMHIYQGGAFIPHLLSTTMTMCYIYLLILPSLLGVTFSNAVSTLKAQSSNVSFATFQWKEMFELWALSVETAFGNVTWSGIGCTTADAKSLL